MNVTAYDIARRFVGIEELDRGDHPLIQWGFMLCGLGPETHDEVPWCSALAQVPPFLLGLPRSKSAAARSWLKVGTPVELDRAQIGFDVVILSRGDGPQPGPDVISAPGHVGFFAGMDAGRLLLLAGNQSDSVNIARYHTERVLGVRRLV
jgi:uncharacterized protein (TIGR02594 family)